MRRMNVKLFDSTKPFQKTLSFGEQSCFLRFNSGAPDGTTEPRGVWAHCGGGTSSGRARFFHGDLTEDPQGTVQGRTFIKKRCFFAFYLNVITVQQTPHLLSHSPFCPSRATIQSVINQQYI